MSSEYKALVIDDDEMICDHIRERLGVLGHECDCAHSIKEAKDFLSQNTYQYVILDMELPSEFGKTPDVSVGETFLKMLRIQYTREQLPILVITAKARENIDLASSVVFAGATDYILKPLALRGDHTLETSIQKFVGGCSVPESPERRRWLFREPEGSNMRWTVRTKNGHEHSYTINASALRCRLLDAIFMGLQKGPVIFHDDIIRGSGFWTKETYYAKDGGASRGPLRGHVNALRRELGMTIKYTEFGIKVEQPEN